MKAWRRPPHAPPGGIPRRPPAGPPPPAIWDDELRRLGWSATRRDGVLLARPGAPVLSLRFGGRRARGSSPSSRRAAGRAAYLDYITRVWDHGASIAQSPRSCVMDMTVWIVTRLRTFPSPVGRAGRARLRAVAQTLWPPLPSLRGALGLRPVRTRSGGGLTALRPVAPQAHLLSWRWASAARAVESASRQPRDPPACPSSAAVRTR